VSADGSRLLFASYLGGSDGRSDPNPTRVWSALGGVGGGWGGGIALDKKLNVYVSSSTNAANFPITAGAAQPKCGSSACGGVSLPVNVYITKISPVGAGAPQDGGSDGAVGASDASTDGAPIADAGAGGAGGKAGAGGVGGTTGAGGAGSGRGGAAGGADAGQADAATFGPGGVAKSGGSSGGCSYSGRAADPSIAVCGLMVLCLLLTSRRRRTTRPAP
jgi:hypothetical protein